MNSESDNYEFLFCADDDEYRLCCESCDKLCIERYYKNHLKSQTHNNIFRKEQQLKIFFTSINLIQIIMSYHCEVCVK